MPEPLSETNDPKKMVSVPLAPVYVSLARCVHDAPAFALVNIHTVPTPLLSLLAPMARMVAALLIATLVPAFGSPVGLDGTTLLPDWVHVVILLLV